MLHWPMLQCVLLFSKKQNILYVAFSKYHFRDHSYITRIQLAVLDHKYCLNQQWPDIRKVNSCILENSENKQKVGCDSCQRTQVA